MFGYLRLTDWIYIVMMFNSISRELSRNGTFQPQNHQSNQKLRNSRQQRTYFPQRPLQTQPLLQSGDHLLNANNGIQNTSAISQMNKKLVDSIQYIRYKDVMRTSELKSSRISSSSNRSGRSNRSSRMTNSNHLYNVHPSPRHRQIRTIESEHYFPTKQSYEYPTWNSKINTPSNPNYPYDSEEFKYLHRKPITIESAQNNYQPNFQKQRAERDENREVSHNRLSNKVSQFFDINKQEQNLRRSQPNQMQNAYANRQFSTSFGGNKPAMNIPEQAQTNRPPEKQQRKQENSPNVLSPLTQTPPKKEGIIVAAVLIALGIILFLLQTLK